MIEVTGDFTSAKIFTVDDSETAIDAHALAQVQMLCDTEACAGSKVRVMPDVHAGKVGPIGLTMTLPAKIMPALIGNDIGCGVAQMRFTKSLPLDFVKLDKEIRKRIPSGSAIHGHVSDRAETPGRDLLNSLHCIDHIQGERALKSLCTLGGGNHFIEMGRSDTSGIIALTVHSGSRNLGQQVFDWYMKAGQKRLRAKGLEIPYEMTWLDGELATQYLEDIQAVCAYAKLNRKLMIKEIVKAMKWKKHVLSKDEELIDCPHNYVAEDGVLRKGAISALEGEQVLIPINMRDGIIAAVGKGNPDWNCSAPHGSGRIFKRSEVSSHHTVSEFKREMKGVWSSCIAVSTLDESPFAYRRLEQIKEALGDTVALDMSVGILKPIYSYKACEVDK
ncbi:RtcB family protein [Anaerotardibacter muris]|uniref:RtcB family protein n=1 Tax=Anaerotardibacter muris TaxID=2941505 RepID=UPI00203EA623|nr:RtcB family protein [Anaerotardibacter muris]